VAHGKIEALSTRPTPECQRTLHQVSRFAGELAAAMTTNNFNLEAGGFGKFHRLSKVSSSNYDFVMTSNELVCERPKERHVR